MAARWGFQLKGGGPTEVATGWSVLTDLSQANSRKVTFQLDGPTTVSFSLDGRDPEALFIEELLTDVVALRDSTRMARARVVGTQDSITQNAHTVSVTCADYRSVLARRLLFAGDAELTGFATPNPAVEQVDIAWSLINRTQSRLQGNFGITNGSLATGVTRNRTYEQGASIGGLLDNLGRVDNGYEWEIDADLVFRTYYPQRGSANGFLLDLGGSVSSCTRAVTSSNFANAVRVNGADGSSPVTATGTVGTEGRWEAQIGDTNISESATITARAQYELDSRGTIVPSYSLGLNSELWTGPSDLWLGDTARLILNSGRLAVDTDVRVLAMDFDLDADGYESVRATVGAYTPGQLWTSQQRELNTRLMDLERR